MKLKNKVKNEQYITFSFILQYKSLYGNYCSGLESLVSICCFLSSSSRGEGGVRLVSYSI